MTNTIVFVHGSFVSKSCWDLWTARFESRGIRCIAIAYPGRDAPVKTLRANPDRQLLASLTITEVLDHHERIIHSLDERPIIIGHSFGGLLTQLLVQRGLAEAAVAIDSVPPQGVMPLRFSFYRSIAPLVNPLAGNRPYMMSFSHFQYAFANGMPLAEQRAAYEKYIVPESRPLARGALMRAGRVDFKKPHAPLLFIGGEIDNLMPASLNRQNYRRYREGSSSLVDYKEFAGLNHFTVIAGSGWERVADYAVHWAKRVTDSESMFEEPIQKVGTRRIEQRRDVHREAPGPQ